MSGKTIGYTALIALVVVIGYESYRNRGGAASVRRAAG
jgi:hypothetical protein